MKKEILKEWMEQSDMNKVSISLTVFATVITIINLAIIFGLLVFNTTR